MSSSRKRRASSSSAAAAVAPASPAARKTTNKKKQVALADDAQDVLKKCRALRKKLSEKKAQEEDDSIPASLEQNIIEVAELVPDTVLEGMENIALKIASQVLNKQGFSMDIPSRAASNQIYVKEWDRIVLGDKRSSRNFLNVKVCKS